MTRDEFHNKLIAEKEKVDTELTELTTNGNFDPLTLSKIGEDSALSQELGAIIAMFEQIDEPKTDWHDINEKPPKEGEYIIRITNNKYYSHYINYWNGKDWTISILFGTLGHCIGWKEID